MSGCGAISKCIASTPTQRPSSYIMRRDIEMYRLYSHTTAIFLHHAAPDSATLSKYSHNNCQLLGKSARFSRYLEACPFLFVCLCVCLYVYVCECVTIVSTGRCLAKSKNVKKTRKFSIVTLTYFLRSNISNVNFAETVKARAKTRDTAFIDFEIFHRITPLPYTYSVILTFFSRSNILNATNYLGYGESRRKNVKTDFYIF